MLPATAHIFIDPASLNVSETRGHELWKEARVQGASFQFTWLCTPGVIKMVVPLLNEAHSPGTTSRKFSCTPFLFLPYLTKYSPILSDLGFSGFESFSSLSCKATGGVSEYGSDLLWLPQTWFTHWICSVLPPYPSAKTRHSPLASPALCSPRCLRVCKSHGWVSEWRLDTNTGRAVWADDKGRPSPRCFLAWLFQPTLSLLCPVLLQKHACKPPSPPRERPPPKRPSLCHHSFIQYLSVSPE